MPKKQKEKADQARYRNIRLSITTYERLDKYTLELMNERGVTKIPLDNAVSSLLDEHERKGKSE